MTIRSLQIFLAVTDCDNSISGASRKLYISQPSVSVAIRELEEEYGVALFERLNRRLYLTEKGKQFRSYARQLCALAKDTSEAMKGGRDVLRVGASISAGAGLMPELIGRFHKKSPDTALFVTSAPSRLLENELLKNDLDLAVCEIPVYDPALKSRVFLSEKLIACAAPSFNLMTNADSLTLAELAALPLLLREKGSGTRTIFDEALAAHSLQAVPFWEASSWEPLLQAAEQGLGIAILPQMIAKDALRQRSLVPIPVEKMDLKQDFSLVWHKDKRISRAMMAFMEMLDIKELPGQG